MVEEHDVARLDQRKLYGTYSEWPKYFREATKFLDLAFPSRPPSYYGSLVFCGMGGSATNCDILQEIVNAHGHIPSIILRNHEMPSFVNTRSLVIVNSVSGNTQESIMMMKAALDRGAEVISISSGGKMKQVAAESRSQHIDIPNLSLPRASLPYLLVPALKIIEPFLSIPLTNHIRSLPEKIDTVLKEIMIDIPEKTNIAKQVARFFADGLPFCYCSPYLLSAATRFKNSLNENAKMHCLRESILEASHNEIVPFTFDHSIQMTRVLLLRWNQDPLVITDRFVKIHNLFDKVVRPVMEISIAEESLLTTLITAIYTLDLSTIYIAIAKNTDPSPTPAIHILKDT